MNVFKSKTHLRNIILFMVVALAITLIRIKTDPLFILRGTPDGSLFSRIGNWGLFNAAHLYLFVCIILGIISFLGFKMIHFIRNFKHYRLILTGHARAIRRYSLMTLLLFTGSVLIELIFSLLTGKNTKGTYFNPYRFCFICCVLLTIVLLILYFKKKIVQTEHLFLFTTLLLGITFIFGMPYTTNVSWDDQIHYKNTVATSFLTIRDYTGADYDMYMIQRKVTYNMNKLSAQMEHLETAVTEPHAAHENSIPFYQAIAYVPAAAAIAINRILHLPFAFGFYAGRYMNLIFYAFTIYFAMKRLKWGKSILAVIALFPTNIFLATNYSYDYFVTALSLLGFAYLIGEMQRPDEKLTLKNALITVGALLIGFGPKAIYFPLILLCLFIPGEKFTSPKLHKRFRLLVVLALFLSIASFVLPFLLIGAGANDARGGSDVNSMEQIKYILFHPIAYTKTLLKFLGTSYLTLDNSTHYTNFMAYLGNGGHGVFSLILLTAASFFDRSEQDKTIFTGKFRTWTCILAFAAICLIATALYVSFTPVGADTIQGCSPRYLAPLIFPVVWCFGLSRIQFGYSKRYLNLAITGFSLFILYHSIWTLCISRYH